MATAPTTPPTVSPWPTAPSRTRPLDFPAEGDAFLGHFPIGQSDQQNTVDWLNSTALEVYNNALEVDEDASKAQAAASVAAGAANFKGLWSELTGSLSIRSSVLHKGTYWYSVVSITDITLNEPSSSNPDWAIVSAQKWNDDAVTTLPLNSYQLFSAVGGDINCALPIFGKGDFTVVNLSPQSDSNMIIAVTGVTIYGRGDSLVDGDNLILQAGDTLHLAADSATMLRVI